MATTASPGPPSDVLDAADSVLVCLPTTTLRDAPLYRLLVTAGGNTDVHQPSQVIVDKIMAVRRDRCGVPIGHVDASTMLALGRLLALVVGIAD